MSDATFDRPRRREADTLIGQVKQIWPALVVAASTVAAGAVAWTSVKTKTYENTEEIGVVKKDVDVLKQGMATQTAILARVEASQIRMERALVGRRRYREDEP